jgi:hypothetical protein
LQQSPGNGNNNKVYPQNPESPSHQSLSNESVESVDSGRDTGGPLTSCSPFNGHDAAAVAAQQQQQQQAAALGVMDNQSAMYEFEIPNTLVGLIIGIGGKTIKVVY